MNDFKKQAANIKITSEVLHENIPISHKLELVTEGSFRLSFNPKSFGYYHVSFYKNDKKIRDSTYIINFFNQEVRDVKCSRDEDTSMLIKINQKREINFENSFTSKDDISEQNSNVQFVLNTKYNQPQHIIGALCKFCPLNKSRIKDLKLEFESGKFFFL